MKQVFFLLSIAFAGYGCNKCGQCTQTTTTQVSPSTPGYPQTTTTNFEACGDNLNDVNGKTTTAKSTVGAVTATTTTKTVCN